MAEFLSPETAPDVNEPILDDVVYDFVKLRSGHYTMRRLAEAIVKNSEGRFSFEDTYETVQTWMGASLDFGLNRTVVIGGPSPAELRKRIDSGFVDSY